MRLARSWRTGSERAGKPEVPPHGAARQGDDSKGDNKWKSKAPTHPNRFAPHWPRSSVVGSSKWLAWTGRDSSFTVGGHQKRGRIHPHRTSESHRCLGSRPTRNSRPRLVRLGPAKKLATREF